MNNRAELSDMIIFVITLFILAIGLFILMYITPAINDGLRDAGLNNSIQGAQAIDSMDYFATHVINNGFLMLFVGLTASLMISSFLVRTHPIFLFLYIFFLAVTVLVSFYLGNAYEQMTSSSVFSTMVETATYSNLVLSHIAEIAIAVGAISMIIVFAKFSSYGGSSQF